jgi:hypothetical protein
MKRIFFITVGICLIQTIASAQNQSTIIKTEALKMAKALAALDLETYASYSWPELLSDPKNKQLLKQGIDSTAKYSKQFGIKVKSIIIGNPSVVVKYKGIMQCTIPQNVTVEAFAGSITTETTLIGLSNNGVKWYFVDANLFSREQTKTKLPALSPQLIIPAQTKPVLKDADGKALDIKQ